ncbi:MAG: GAF domain-containing protein [Oscillatoria princeps RMCB-10]|jgi:GAF domain-containing protein|nr:GAF domain-containing protein [Oscillatoria princeps RMCB-10]
MGQQKQPPSYEKQLVALGRTLQTLREEENVDVLIETTLNYLEAEFECKLLWIGLYDRLDHRLLGKGGRTPNGDLSLLKQRFTLTPGDLLEQVVIQQRPVGVPDLREELRAGEWRKVAQQFAIQGTLIFPMRYKDRCFGVALLGSNLWGVSPRTEEKARLSLCLGGLAAALYQIETDWLRQQTKHPDQSLLKLLTQLRELLGSSDRSALSSLDQCLAAAVEETHKFVAPDRTNIYWYNPERRYFWSRVSNHQKMTHMGVKNQPASGLMVSDLGGFYQALLSDQIVSIGEAHSSLKADVTARLMQQIRARSLLAAPIVFQKEILGFLAVEGNDARIWQEEEKSYVRGAAQLLALVAPVAEMERTIERVKLDRDLTAGIARAIYSDSDWHETLKTAGLALLERLKADRFLVLLYSGDRNQFDICYQNQPASRRLVPAPLLALSDVDTKLLQDSPEAIGIENWTEDLKLMAWRSTLLENGAKSLLACTTGTAGTPEGVLLVTCDAPRTWNATERELVTAVSRQIGLVLHQWQLHAAREQDQHLLNTVRSGLLSLQQTSLTLEELERSVVKQLAEFVACPLAALVTWSSGSKVARIAAEAAASSQYALNLEASVPVHTEALIQWALLQAEGPLPVRATDLPLETKTWLSGPGIGQILVMALRTGPEHEPQGIALVADHSERHWSPTAVKAMTFLGSQLAWSRRYVMLSHTLQSQRQDLECLNWYKHRRYEDFYRVMASGVKKLTDLANHKGNFGSLQVMRLEQILRQLSNCLESLHPLLKEERWRLQADREIIPLASLLRRVLERLGPVIHQHQLWCQVHGESSINISGDALKIEWAVHEVLLAACRRSPQGGRIDIWCRLLDLRCADLSVTDSGVMPPTLIADLQTGRSADVLAPSSLDQPPGLHLAICLSLLQQMGGELHFSQMDDGRTVSQFVLPLAHS